MAWYYRRLGENNWHEEGDGHCYWLKRKDHSDIYYREVYRMEWKWIDMKKIEEDRDTRFDFLVTEKVIQKAIATFNVSKTGYKMADAIKAVLPDIIQWQRVGDEVRVTDKKFMDRHFLIAGDSGYSSTPLRAAVGSCSSSKGEYRDHANDRFTDGGEEAKYWFPLLTVPGPSDKELRIAELKAELKKLESE